MLKAEKNAEENKQNQEEECGICLLAFEDDEVLKVLDCPSKNTNLDPQTKPIVGKHLFHT